MLDKNYEWDKVVELKITETTEQKFLPLLHNVDAEKVDIFTRKMQQDIDKRELERKLAPAAGNTRILVQPIESKTKQDVPAYKAKGDGTDSDPIEDSEPTKVQSGTSES